ncbi:hypothetical protein B0H14DRAFT_2561922 [Mycena olivaceomarginata]|nr:hypothetical protein B0H14DRAFT_2561922 [Mycena olivaceomarginata]
MLMRFCLWAWIIGWLLLLLKMFTPPTSSPSSMVQHRETSVPDISRSPRGSSRGGVLQDLTNVGRNNNDAPADSALLDQQHLASRSADRERQYRKPRTGVGVVSQMRTVQCPQHLDHRDLAYNRSSYHWCMIQSDLNISTRQLVHGLLDYYERRHT